ncbi:hypothetical protein [Streptomyces mirabilis]|uniref:hypothetical protein n=1 Tax=Streptomyces mirabilis TaxID=68239 RepID=UPI0036D7CFD4
MGNVREFPPELERQLVKAKEWDEEIFVAGDPDADARHNAEGAAILEEIVAICEMAWGWGRDS